PPSGQLTTSQTQQPVVISAIPCSNASFTFTDQNNNTATVMWSCMQTPPPTHVVSTLAASPTNLLPSVCPWHSEAFLCKVTLTESSNSQGNLNWTASSTGSASITPSSGT